jgi:hypothetical protein
MRVFGRSGQKWAEEVGKSVPERVKAQAGGEFFCQPNFTGSGPCGAFTLTLGTPQPPQQVLDQLSAEQAAKKQKTRVETEEETIKKLVKILGPNGYIAYRALNMAEKGQSPPVVFIPQGSNAIVDARAR